jgi:hypothetical protein
MVALTKDFYDWRVSEQLVVLHGYFVARKWHRGASLLEGRAIDGCCGLVYREAWMFWSKPWSAMVVWEQSIAKHSPFGIT